MVARFVRTIRLLGVLLGLMLLGLPAHAQVQRKPKGPKPPSYEEVMQRALIEKQAASNAAAAAVVTPRVNPPLANPPPAINRSTPKAAPPTVTPVTELKNSGLPPAVLTPGDPVSSTPTTSYEVAPKTVAPVAPAAPAITTRTESQPPVVSPRVVNVDVPVQPATVVRSSATKAKGPVFSELPPDLRPGAVPGQLPSRPQADSTSTGKTVPDTSTNAMDALDEKHLLAIGDRLSFRIVEDEEKNPKELVVTDSGELEVPHIGRFYAEGKSCKELARALKAELEKEYYYKATVIVAVDLMARSRGRVYCFGAVRMPGSQEIPSDEVLTLSKAVLRAGGFTDFANKRNVKVTRRGSGPGFGDQTYTVNVEQILEQGKTEADMPLQAGDMIRVQERMIRF